MRTINVTELKARLSSYLRIAARGERIVVKDRDEPIAQLGPLEREPESWRKRLGREGRLRLGSQDWESIEISELGREIRIQESLDAVREDASEVHRR
jgi:antitoxin (DNA-binding transcriptional repressor) of toxin-antitoxin stability system